MKVYKCIEWAGGYNFTVGKVYYMDDEGYFTLNMGIKQKTREIMTTSFDAHFRSLDFKDYYEQIETI